VIKTELTTNIFKIVGHFSQDKKKYVFNSRNKSIIIEIAGSKDKHRGVINVLNIFLNSTFIKSQNSLNCFTRTDI